MVLFLGGDIPGTVAVTENWNGNNWVEVADLNQSRGIYQGHNSNWISFCRSNSPQQQQQNHGVEVLIQLKQ